MPKISPIYEMWFDVPPEQAPGRVLLRDVKDGEQITANLQATVRKTTRTSEGVVQEQITDLASESDSLLCLAIKDWEDFTDEAGEALPCTDANKRKFAAEGWFRPWIAEKRNELAEYRAKQQQAVRGN